MSDSVSGESLGEGACDEGVGAGVEGAGSQCAEGASEAGEGSRGGDDWLRRTKAGALEGC